MMTNTSHARKLKLVERLQIMRCLDGRELTCGCVVGHYLTRAGRVLTVVDKDADDCRERLHQVDFVIAEGRVDSPRPASL